MNHNIGANIRTYRKNKGFTQEELAGLLGVTAQAVSRWESEAGFPDLGLIVPIAQILGITTDTLLGYDKANQDDAITKRIFDELETMKDETDRWGNALKRCDYLCEETTKYPTNYAVQLEYVQQVAHLSMLVDLEGFLKDQPERYNKLYTDGIRKGIQVVRYSNDRELIDKAHYALAWIYIHKKDYENAREHIEMLPSLASNRVKESINMELTYFEKGFEDMKDVIVENSKVLFSVIGKQLQVISQNYGFFATKEEALRICTWSDALLDAYTTIPGFYNPRTYYHLKVEIALYRMVAYSRAGEPDNVQTAYQDFLASLEDRQDLSTEEYEELKASLDTQRKWYIH